MEVSNLTKDYLNKLFSSGKRFDGRKLEDYRDVEVSVDVSNKAEGSARVKLGKTEVVVGVKLGIGEPYPDSPDKGNLMCTGELLLLASPRFEAGPPGFQAIELGRLLDRAIRESGMIDLSKLVITPGEKVWTIYLDIYPINDDGNLLDAANIGAIVALKNAKMPSLDKDGKIDYENRKGGLPLSKEIAPLSVSFYKLGETIIVDPTREEEEACETRVTFGISKWNKHYMVNACQKAGQNSFTEEEMNKILDLLPKEFEELNKRLKNHL
ncbi:MAG: exosome complex protein Rrp42 [Nanoarchaeota archaeon]